MKSYLHSKGKPAGRINPQQAVYELKHKVVVALNKLADRDTYQIAVEELEKVAEGLTAEGIVPFLSCIVDTDSEQKSAVRKECIRIMGVLAKFHGNLLSPHLGKMVSSVVKRLKDPDSVVRDACVETVGVLASTVRCYEGENGGPFVVLARPLFEALGEQNKQVQSGSSMCLARAIDNASDFPISVLARMLTRILKLLKNQHFMAKPALIELIRSIIQAGGASLDHALSAALAGIQEALKNTEWTTRKAASTALASIATSCGSLLGPFKTSSIHALESCRFDKVKPVRDSVTQAIQCWKNLSGIDSPEPSEAGSSTKENFRGGDYSAGNRAKEKSWKDYNHVNAESPLNVSRNFTCSVKKRSPLAVRKPCANHVQNPQHYKKIDWNIEIAVPKTCKLSLADARNEESEGSCVTKSFGGTMDNTTESHDVGCDDTQVDEKLDSSTILDIASGSFETICKKVAHNTVEGNDPLKAGSQDTHWSIDENYFDGHISSSGVQDRSSLDSTVTELRTQVEQGCCSHNARELTEIRKQLLEIESRQSSLMDLLQVYMESSMDTLSVLQSKVLSLEHAMEKIAECLMKNTSHSSIANSKLLKSNLSVSHSPRLSTCTPRPSVDSTCRKSSASTMSRDMWDECLTINKRPGIPVKQGAALWREPAEYGRNFPATKGMENHCNLQNGRPFPPKEASSISSRLYNNSHKEQNLESSNSLRIHVKDNLSMGDLESAFVEAIYSNSDRLYLIDLMDRTGPVLDRLSLKTTSELLNIVTSDLLDQRFIDSILPWLHQVAQLSTTEVPNCFRLSAKAKKDVLSALQKALSLDIRDAIDRRSISQIALRLHQVWGKCH